MRFFVPKIKPEIKTKTKVTSPALLVLGLFFASLGVVFTFSILSQPALVEFKQVREGPKVLPRPKIDAQETARLERVLLVREKTVLAQGATTEFFNRVLSLEHGRRKIVWSKAEVSQLTLAAKARREQLRELIKAGPEGVAEARRIGKKNLRELIPAVLRSDLLPYLEEAVSYRGKVRVYSASENDEPDHGHFSEYWLDGNFSGGQVQLFFEEPPPDLSTGDELAISGLRVGDYLASGSGDSQDVTSIYKQKPFGEQKLLLMLVNFRDKTEQPYTKAHAEGIMAEVNTHLKNNSLNQAYYTSRVLDWMTLPLTVGSTCPTSQIMTEAIKAANTLYSDIDFTQYQRLVVAFPTLPCGYAGLGGLGLESVSTPDGAATASLAWINGKRTELSFRVTTHELGHNFGVHHSNTLDCGAVTLDIVSRCQRAEYGDPYDIMGGGPGDFTAWKKFLVGWIPPANVVDVGIDSPGGRYTLRALEQNTGPQLIKVFRGYDGWGQKLMYFLEKRSSTLGNDAYFSQTPPPLANGVVYPYHLDGVLVSFGLARSGTTDTGYNQWLLDFTPSQLFSAADFRDARLSAGQSFTDPFGIKITTVSDTDSTVVVDVTRPLTDTKGPVLALTNPKLGTEARGTVILKADVWDDRSAVSQIDFFKDGQRAGTGQFGKYAPASYSWDTAKEVNGSIHTWRLEGRDAAGNLGVSPEFSFAVNNSPPTVAVALPLAGATVQGVVSVQIDAKAPTAAGRLEYVKLFVDGVEVVKIPNLFVKPYGNLFDGTWDTRLFANASHIVTAEATAADGTSGSSAPITVNIANPAPVARITSPLDGAVLTDKTAVTVELVDPLKVSSVKQVVLFADRVETATDISAPFEFLWDPGVYNIARSLTARVDFLDGTSGYASPITITVRRYIALARFTAPAPDAQVSGTVPVKIEILERYQPMASSLLSIDLYVDAAQKMTIKPPGDDLLHYTLLWDSTTVKSEAHELFAVLNFDYGLTGQTGPLRVHVTNQQNLPPTANAGADITTVSGSTVILNGTASSDPEGDPITYLWTQKSGLPQVTLTNPESASPIFTSPSVATPTSLTFTLTVDNSAGSSSDDVTVTIQPIVQTSALLPITPKRFVLTPGMKFDVDMSGPSGMSSVAMAAQFTHEDSITKYSRTYTLYDDGLHDDGKAQDGMFGNHITIENGFKLGSYQAIFSIDSGGFVRQDSYRLKIIAKVAGECKEFVLGKNSASDSRRWNLVFLPVARRTDTGATLDWRTFFKKVNFELNYDRAAHPLGYYTVGEFDPVNQPNAFFNLPAVSEYRDGFNVWYIDPMYTGSVQDTAALEEYMVARCPQFSRSQFLAVNSVLYGWSSSVIGLGTSTLSKASYLSHEFGHALAGLTDEYADLALCKKVPSAEPLGRTEENVYYASESTNTQAGCDEYAGWRYLKGGCYTGGKLYFETCPSTDDKVFCYKGAEFCDATGYNWRPTYGSIWGQVGTGVSTPHITAFCRQFENYFGERRGVCNNICLDGCAAGSFCRDPDNDGVGACVSAGVTNQPPAANAGPDQSVLGGTTVTLDGSRSSDPEGGLITYRWTRVSGLAVTLSSATAVKPTFTAPLVTAAGTVTFQLTVTDTGGLVGLDSVTITIQPVITSNRPPDFAPIADVSGKEGQAIAFGVSATDPDGDTLAYTAAPIPQGGVFTASMRRFDWTPSYTQAGTYIVTFTVSDGRGGTDSQQVTLTIANTNRSPVIAPVAQKSGAEGTLMTFTIFAADPDGDTVTLSAQNLPSGASFDPSATQRFIWTPEYTQAGTYTVTFTAKDPSGLFASLDVTLAISDATPETPLAQNISFVPKVDTGLDTTLREFVIAFLLPVTGEKVFEIIAEPSSGGGGGIPLPTDSTLTEQSYDMVVSSKGFLRKRTRVSITSNTALTLPLLEAGDFNEDSIVNSVDFSLMNAKWFFTDIVLDINKDGIVNSIDFSYLNKNWNKTGD